VNVQTGESLWGKNSSSIRDIASLTKIMTLFVVKQCLRHKLVTENDIVTVPREATVLGGTSAYLRTNDQIRLVDLLFGMMLPSGNDAAYTLAEFCGGLMAKDPRLNKKKRGLGNVDFFVKQMNMWAKQLKLKNTLFLNPHGLSHLGNHSTAYEISRIACLLIKRPFISDIVQTCKYSCVVHNLDIPRKINWVNTNLLLGTPGVTGLKTGQTQTAGPCLCVTFTTRGISLCITLLKTRTADKRWSEALKLHDWAMSQLESIFTHSEKSINSKNLSNFISSLNSL
jgi:D-alanyl-D-alanine carboxypeptidase